MRAGRSLCFAAGVFGFVCGGTAAAQTAEIEAKLQFELLGLRLQQLQAQQKQPGRPAPKINPPVPGSLPLGAVARLGDSRLRHAGLPTCVCFSPDGKRVFSGGQDGAIRVWSVATGESVAALQLGYTPAALRFTPDGKLLAVSADNVIRFLNPATLAHVAAFSTGNGSAFDLSSDGKLVVALAADGVPTVTELESGLPKLELPPGGRFAFHPDGKSVALADDKGTVTLYRLTGGKPVATFAHGGAVNGLSFSPDGTRLATGGAAPAVVKVWDVGNPKIARPVTEIPGTTNPRVWLGNDRVAVADAAGAGVYDLAEKKWVGFAKGVAGEWAVSADGTQAAATGTNGLRVRIWDLTTGKQLHADDDTFPDPALLLPTADGRAVFVLAGDAAFHWPVDKPTATPAGTLPGKALVAAVGRNRLAVVTPDGVLIYDDFDPARPLPAEPSRRLTEHATGCRSVTLTADGAKVAYSGDTQRTVIADAATGDTIRVLPPAPVGTVGLALAFSPDGERLAVVGRDGFLKLWPVKRPAGDDVSLWQIRIQRGTRGTVAFSPDGRRIAAAASARLVVVDATDGGEAFYLDRVDLDDGIYQHAAFSPDGRLLVTGSAGLTGAVQVWEVATRSPVRRFTTGLGSVNRLGVFPDGTRIVTAGAEEAVTLWDVDFPHGRQAPTADELRAAWGDLDSLDGSTGYRARRVLTAGGPKGVRVMAAGLEETLSTRKNVTRWVTELGSDDFPTREAATKALMAQGLRALPAVQEAATRADSPEARARAAVVVDKLTAKGLRVPDHGLAGDDLLFVRAVQVLEDVGGDEAMSLLATIAKQGGPAADVAKAALRRRGGR